MFTAVTLYFLLLVLYFVHQCSQNNYVYCWHLTNKIFFLLLSPMYCTSMFALSITTSIIFSSTYTFHCFFLFMFCVNVYTVNSHFPYILIHLYVPLCFFLYVLCLVTYYFYYSLFLPFMCHWVSQSPMLNYVHVYQYHCFS